MIQEGQIVLSSYRITWETDRTRRSGCGHSRQMRMASPEFMTMRYPRADGGCKKLEVAGNFVLDNHVTYGYIAQQSDGFFVGSFVRRMPHVAYI